MKSIVFLVLVSMTSSAFADISNLELGVGAGRSYPKANDNFSNSASSGDTQHYWLGYKFSPSWLAELSYENLDYDDLDLSSKVYSLGASYLIKSYNPIHPFLRAGLSYGDHKFAQPGPDGKKSFGFLMGAGLNFNFFKYVGFQAGINYLFSEKVSADLKSAQTLNPYVGIVIRFGEAAKEVSAKVEKAVESVKSAPVIVDTKAVDSDGDGVSDSKDKCPGTKPNVVVTAYGCAETETASISIAVLFKPGKAEIQEATLGEVQKLAEFMKEFPATQVHVKGHTDSTGPKEINKKISQLRADTVKAELVKLGVSEARIQSTGYGPEFPVADNKTAEGRKANRRVVAEVTTTTEKKK